MDGRQYNAENFRNLLLNYHNLRGKEATKFENIVMNLSDGQITKLAAQYKNAIQVWQESEGEAGAISQDFMRRVNALGQSGVQNAAEALLKGNRGRYRAAAMTKKLEKIKEDLPPATELTDVEMQTLWSRLGLQETRVRHVNRQSLENVGNTWYKIKGSKRGLKK